MIGHCGKCRQDFACHGYRSGLYNKAGEELCEDCAIAELHDPEALEQAQLLLEPLVWTTDPPTKGGWYCIEGRDGGKVVHEVFGCLVPGVKALYLNLGGTLFCEVGSCNFVRRWAGPILFPVEPEEKSTEELLKLSGCWPKADKDVLGNSEEPKE